MKNHLVLLAGAAVGLSANALAQTANLDENRAYAAELRADAEGRSSLLQGTTQAGSGGFTISDASGDYSLTVQGQSQTQFHVNVRGEAPAGDEDTTIGFQQRRTKMFFSGNVVNPDWGYHIEFGAFEGFSSLQILDVYGTYQMDEGMELQWGQFKAPFSREFLVDSRHQLSADRSVTDSVFSGGRTQGVMLNYASDDFRFSGSFNDGFATATTPFNSAAEADYGFTGRGEWKFSGDNWDAFDDFTSFQNSEYSGMVGGAFHWQSGGSTGGPTADVDVLAITVDVSVEGDGWNAFGAIHWNSTDVSGGAETDNLGVVIQGGIFIAESDELFGRYDIVIPDDDVASGDNFSTLTVGWNHYFSPESHAVKMTAGVQVFLDDQSMSSSVISPNPGIGLLSDTDSGQFDIFGQMQILF